MNSDADFSLRPTPHRSEINKNQEKKTREKEKACLLVDYSDDGWQFDKMDLHFNDSSPS